MPRPPCHLVLAVAATILAACMWAGCSKPHRASSPSTTAEAGPYVGAPACAECHAELFQRQAESHHALTLRPGDRQSLPDDAKDVLVRDREAGLDYRLAPDGERLRQVVHRNGTEVASASLDFLLGSGHHGISPMSFDGKEWKYLSLTYYAKGGWDLSPMHGLGDAATRQKHAAGWPVSTQELEKCFGCHATRIGFRGASLDPAATELGVRCESCHGPGRAHVEAMRSKSATTAIENPGQWSSENFMALCQQCHNETATLEGTLMGIPEDPASPKTVKYHVYGISQSRCYTADPKNFRCTTCHDPHGNSPSEPAFYEAKCLSCHTQGVAKQAHCPVSPEKGCLPCHMPQVKVEKYTYFADHWIRARSPFAPKAQAATGSRQRLRSP